MMLYVICHAIWLFRAFDAGGEVKNDAYRELAIQRIASMKMDFATSITFDTFLKKE